MDESGARILYWYFCLIQLNYALRHKQFLFVEGNWLSGGPDNLIEYITRTLGKLLDILLNRKQTPQIDVPTDMDIPNGDPMVNSARQTAMENEKMRNTLSDLLRMLPADRINLNDLNLNMNRQ